MGATVVVVIVEVVLAVAMVDEAEVEFFLVIVAEIETVGVVL